METPIKGFRPHSGAERREWDRLPISIPLFVSGRESTGAEFLEFSTALNVSAGGVLLATKRDLKPDSHVSLEVPIALANKAELPHSVSVLDATVLRCTRERRYFLLGLRFVKPLIPASSESEDDSSAANAGEDHNSE